MQFYEQQAALRLTIETQIVPYMCTTSELLVDVCEPLPGEQQTKLHRLRHPSTTSHSPLSPSLLPSGIFSTHLKQIH